MASSEPHKQEQILSACAKSQRACLAEPSRLLIFPRCVPLSSAQIVALGLCRDVC